MKQRSIGKMFFLFIITFGLYRFYWVYATRKEMVEKGQKIPTFLLFLLPYILLITGAVVAMSTLMANMDTVKKVPAIDNVGFNKCLKENVYSIQECGRQYREKADFTTKPNADPDQIIAISILYLIILAWLPLTALFYWPYSKAVENVTKQKLSFPLAMVSILLVPDGFDFLIIQDGFNKVAKA